MQKSPQNSCLWGTTVSKKQRSLNGNGPHMENVSECQWSPNVNSPRTSTVSECQWSPNANDLWMSEVSKWELSPNVNTFNSVHVQCAVVTEKNHWSWDSHWGYWIMLPLAICIFSSQYYWISCHKAIPNELSDLTFRFPFTLLMRWSYLITKQL